MSSGKASSSALIAFTAPSCRVERRSEDRGRAIGAAEVLLDGAAAALRRPAAEDNALARGEPGFGKRAPISVEAVPEVGVVGRGDQQRDVAVAELEQVPAAAIAGVEIPRSDSIEVRMAEVRGRRARSVAGPRETRASIRTRPARRRRAGRRSGARSAIRSAAPRSADLRRSPPPASRSRSARRSVPTGAPARNRTRCRDWGPRCRRCASRRAGGSTPCGWTCSRAPPPPREPRGGGLLSRRASLKAHSRRSRATRRRAPRRRGSSAAATAISAARRSLVIVSTSPQPIDAERSLQHLSSPDRAAQRMRSALPLTRSRNACQPPLCRNPQATRSEAASAATVDQLAGDPARVVAGKEADDVGDVASHRRSA